MDIHIRIIHFVLLFKTNAGRVQMLVSSVIQRFLHHLMCDELGILLLNISALNPINLCTINYLYRYTVFDGCRIELIPAKMLQNRVILPHT